MSDKPRLVRRAALALIVVGGLAMVTASGGLVSSNADRGVSLAIADDPDAYLGLEYPDANASRVVELESSNSNSDCGEFSFTFSCEYTNVELLLVTDQTPGGQLSLDQLASQPSGDDITEDISQDTPPGALRRVVGTFECSAFFGFQLEANATITHTIEASSQSDSISVSTEREVDVVCVPD